MKFPINVSKTMREAGKSTGIEKFTALFAFTGFIDFFIFTQLEAFTRGSAFLTGLLFFIIVFFSIVLLIQVIRRFVVREDDKFIEHDKSKDATLADYYYIVEKENNEIVDSSTVFEYRDGNFMVAIKFTYGYTSDTRAESTRKLFMFIYNEVLKREMEVRTENMPEKFSESRECKRFKSSMAEIEEKSVADAMMSITTNLLDICDSYSQMFDTVMIIRTKNPYQVQNMISLIRIISDEFRKHVCSLRGMEFLDQSGLRAFLTEYYCLEALDLTNLKLIDVDTETLLKYRNLVKVHKVELSTGEIKEVSKINLKTGSVKIK